MLGLWNITKKNKDKKEVGESCSTSFFISNIFTMHLKSYTKHTTIE